MSYRRACHTSVYLAGVWLIGVRLKPPSHTGRHCVGWHAVVCYGAPEWFRFRKTPESTACLLPGRILILGIFVRIAEYNHLHARRNTGSKAMSISATCAAMGWQHRWCLLIRPNEQPTR